jgi:hypothetical protein
VGDFKRKPRGLLKEGIANVDLSCSKAFGIGELTAPASVEPVTTMIRQSHRKATSDHVHMRKSNPLNEVLPLTRNWLASLPPHVRPTSLIEQHARIVNSIAFAWNDPLAMTILWTGLLIDHRGDREGFPAAVVGELQALQDHFYHIQ